MSSKNERNNIHAGRLKTTIYTVIVRKNKTYTANLSTALQVSDNMFTREVVIKLKKTYYRSQRAVEQEGSCHRFCYTAIQNIYLP